MPESEYEFDWPNRDDRLFRPRPPKRHNQRQGNSADSQSVADSFFEWQHELMWNLAYRDGWFAAADNLARDLTQRVALEKLDPEREFHGVYLVILYCYRHYVEVSLKHLIEILLPLSGLEPRVKLDGEHGLMALWGEAERQLEQVLGPPQAGDDTRKCVRALISELHGFDPSSQTFRYRRDKHGRPHEDSIPSADLDQLGKVMRGLRNYFDGLEDCVDQVHRNLEDMRSQM